MPGVRTKLPAKDALATALTVDAVSGEPLLGFSPEVVNSLRHMVTSLACAGGIPSRLSVAAALREEGVTSTTLAFGTVLANDTARNVCVVELNWWYPGLRNLLARDRGGASGALPPELADRPGLAEVVMGSATLDQAVIPTARPNLSVVAAGATTIDQRPVIARSDTLKHLLAQLAERYDCLLLDVPAVLATSDAIALASLGEACVMVVRHGVTPVASVQLALDDLRHLQMLGVVLNQVRFATPSWLRDLIPQE